MTTKTHATSHTAHAAPAAEEPAAAPAKASTKYAPKPVPAELAASSALTADQVNAMIEQLDTMAAQFSDGASPLTIDARRKLLKMRPGGEAQATTVMTVADRYGLALPGVSSADVASNIQLATNLGTLIGRLQSVLGLATDVSLTAQSKVWGSATKAYSTLVRLVPEYPSLQRELAPMASFMATKYKDAPTSLRSQEKKALGKARSARAKKAAASGGAETAGQNEETSATVETAGAQTAATAAPTAATAPKPANGANAPS